MRSTVGFLLMAGGAFAIFEGVKYFTKTGGGGSSNTSEGFNQTTNPVGGSASETVTRRTQLARSEWDTDVPQNVKNQINAAIQATGAPDDWKYAIAYIMRRESSYGTNLGSYNSYLYNGTAYGVMQFKRATWESTQSIMPQRSTPYDVNNPVDNIIGSIEYIHQKYGTPQNTDWFKAANPKGY